MNVRDVLVDHLLEILENAILKEEPAMIAEVQAIIKRLEDLLSKHHPEIAKIVNPMLEGFSGKPIC